MLASGDLSTIASLCKAIGNEVTDDTGFVPVRRLLSRFHAELHIRPLLVEGMLASVDHKNGGKWAVLVDSETYPVSKLDVEEERPTRPLPQRMRNTIAHELVHSLAFRTSEFGLRLKARIESNESLREFVEAIELETEKLSPLLLWSEKGLEMLLKGRKETLSLSDLLGVQEDVGISRYVLINRLILLQRDSDSREFFYSAGLRNLAIGIGQWGPQGGHFKCWPIFWNFDNGIVPSFLLKISGHDGLPAREVLSDESFAMLGGPNSVVTLDATAGTQTVPNAKKMEVQIAVEEVLRRQGNEFLFVVRRIGAK